MFLDVAQLVAPTQKRIRRKPVGLKYAFIVQLWTEPNLAKWQWMVKLEPEFRTTNPKSLEQCLCKAIGVFLFLPPLFLEFIATVSALGLSFGCEMYQFAKWVASRDRNVHFLDARLCRIQFHAGQFGCSLKHLTQVLWQAFEPSSFFGRLQNIAGLGKGQETQKSSEMEETDLVYQTRTF